MFEFVCYIIYSLCFDVVIVNDVTRERNKEIKNKKMFYIEHCTFCEFYIDSSMILSKQVEISNCNQCRFYCENELLDLDSIYLLNCSKCYLYFNEIINNPDAILPILKSRHISRCHVVQGWQKWVVGNYIAENWEDEHVTQWDGTDWTTLWEPEPITWDVGDD